jgi:predicted nucleic acid-binding protein
VILVDTNVMVDILREHAPALEWLKSLGEEEIGLPGLVEMELLQGPPDKTAMNKMQKDLESFLIYWPKTDDCNRALKVFAEARLSHRVTILDALIGETANGLGVPLHTFDQHFQAIPGLKTVQPYTKP